MVQTTGQGPQPSLAPAPKEPTPLHSEGTKSCTNTHTQMQIYITKNNKISLKEITLLPHTSVLNKHWSISKAKINKQTNKPKQVGMVYRTVRL